MPPMSTPLYQRYARAIAGERLPLAMVDLDAVDRNIETLFAPVRASGKTLRVATKSLRCVELLRYVLERGGAAARGLMAFSAVECAHLADAGFDDILLAYPTVQPHDTALLAALSGRAGLQLSVVVDCAEHLAALSTAASAAAAATTIHVVVEADMALQAAGGRVHIGVQRSPLRTAAAVVALAERAASTPGLRLRGVMAYDAQIAGLGDNNPFSPAMNPARRLVRALSRPFVAEARAAIADGLRARGLPFPLYNGGGTGSLAWASQEPHLTELAAGSGFVDSHLFDYYRGLRLEPALFFALQVVRAPGPGVVTCAGGGLVASGQPGADRLPVPALPEGLRLTPMEGAGEVQTPLMLPAGTTLPLGAPVFFRHAKAGELAEHFARYLLVRGEAIERAAPTYRGEGLCSP
jgi:D-serine deaminase-like pyridoxal phosphate-dependent protein